MVTINKHTKGRPTAALRALLGWTSTKADRKRKKIARQRRRLGRIHNGRK